jgi:hypothetical protein
MNIVKLSKLSSLEWIEALTREINPTRTGHRENTNTKPLQGDMIYIQLHLDEKYFNNYPN